MHNKKVLLINSPTLRNQYTSPDNYFPLGLLSLATALRRANIDAEVMDVNNDFYLKEFNEGILQKYIENHVCRYINDYAPDVIGIGCIFSGAFKSLKIIAGALKDRFPDIPVVIGGIHATIFAREIMDKYNFIDYVVIGEGEHSFPALLKSIFNKDRHMEAIDGIAYRSDGAVRINPKTSFITDLDTLPFIDYGILNVDEYKMDTSWWFSPKKLKLGQPFPIISSRSCPERCAFCSMWLVHGPMLRVRSADNVLDEMEHLYREYNVRVFNFMDDNMTFNKKRTLEICNGILRRNMNIQFDTPNGLAVKRLDREIIDALVDAGMTRISIAIESGSEYIRNEVMRKGLSNQKIYEVAEDCARHRHLFVQAFFIAGMPQETHETLEETYEMIKRLPLDKLGIFYATPYPGTKLFNYCNDHKLLESASEELVDVEHLQHLADTPHFKPHNLSIDDLISFRERCYGFMDKKRTASGIPGNIPMRYREMREGAPA